ncbi:shikimate dehydrogenase [Nocardioides sp. Y6]|uniref:Shikimate dehydrogenase n=1 Tax=Nocardioides malaquae TaxID=2773426 RepID=A0ABR9RRZ0_9ACTN|nr:shikimate dehydrogenase [Nocardioides malaquae]MBE7324334.1 shikimate dehydrogenase [Nocardioides malaquae]
MTAHVCGVLGDPVAHSLSPVLHRAAYQAHDLDWTYDAHRVGAGGLQQFLAGLDESWRGLSLTMPLKREAMGLVDTLSDVARVSSAVNTVVIEHQGGSRVLHGDNTDVPGAVAALRERGGAEGPQRATILGGGATATSVGLALLSMGVREIDLLVRTPERATETRDVLVGWAADARVRVLSLDAVVVPGDVVVSTVPAAAQGEALVERLAGAAVVFDVVYDPWPTPLVAACDGVVVSGLDLLVHQATFQFELFTGRPAPLAVMRAAGEQALAARNAGR